MDEYIKVLPEQLLPNSDLRDFPRNCQVWNPLAVRTRMLVIWGDRPAVLNLAFLSCLVYRTQPKFLFKLTDQPGHITFATHHSSLIPQVTELQNVSAQETVYRQDCFGMLWRYV